MARSLDLGVWLVSRLTHGNAGVSVEEKVFFACACKAPLCVDADRAVASSAGGGVETLVDVQTVLDQRVVARHESVVAYARRVDAHGIVVTVTAIDSHINVAVGIFA